MTWASTTALKSVGSSASRLLRGWIERDIKVRDVDEALAERVKPLALACKWSINEVIPRVLRHCMGLAASVLSPVARSS